MRFMNLSLAVVLCLLNASAYAAPGDLLFQCSFDGAGATPQEVWHNCDPTNTNTLEANSAVSIINAGCVSGKCYKMNFTTTTGVYAEKWFPMRFYPPGTKYELTIEFYERYNKMALDFGNVKQMRVIHPSAPGYQAYLLAPISWHSNAMGGTDPWWYTSSFAATLLPISNNATWNFRCGTAKVYNRDGSIECASDSAFDWRLNQSVYPATSWVKVRYYNKLPTTGTSRDGEIWLWINDELMFKLYNLDRPGLAQRDITEIIWEPSIGAKESVEHYYDEIKVWEGFVAPDGSSPPLQQKAPAPPTSLLIQ